jgi:hypothetical protein
VEFSSVRDPVMFQRILDAADYWFGYSDDSSAGSYDPAWECFVVVINDQANGANAVGAGDGEVPSTRELDHSRARGQIHCRGVPTSTHSQPKRASPRPSLRRSIAQWDCFAPPLLEKLPCVANARTS